MANDLESKRARYFLPDGYGCNLENITFNDGSGNVYWDEKRCNSPATRIFQFPVYQYLTRLIAERGAKTLVDVGCGVGAKLKHVHAAHPSLEITGIDQDDAISFCKRSHDFGAWVVDNFDDPDDALKDVRADIVVCSDVIEHVQNPNILLDYLRARVKVGGIIVLSTPDRVCKYGAALNRSGHHSHVREWSKDELGAYLEDRGFKVLDHFHQYPVRVGFSKIFLRETYNQIRSGNRLKYNQVCVIEVQ